MASSKSQAAGAGDQQVLDISQLPIQQLNQFVKTLEKVSIHLFHFFLIQSNIPPSSIQ